MTHLSLADTVDLLAEALPHRALHDLCGQKHGGYPSMIELRHMGVTDRTITQYLIEYGVPHLQITRAAMYEILAKKGIGRDVKGIDFFAVVDKELRGEKNPLLPHVRTILEQLLKKRDTL